MHRRHRVTESKKYENGSLSPRISVDTDEQYRKASERERKKKGGQLVPRSFCVEEGGL